MVDQADPRKVGTPEAFERAAKCATLLDEFSRLFLAKAGDRGPDTGWSMQYNMPRNRDMPFTVVLTVTGTASDGETGSAFFVRLFRSLDQAFFHVSIDTGNQWRGAVATITPLILPGT